MNDILQRIVERRNEDVARQARRVSRRTLAQSIDASQMRRSLYRVIEGAAAGGTAIIAEIKRASPSKGVLCRGLDPARLARVYQAAGAAAISVLTEPRFFQGTMGDLRRVREQTQLPVLRKDFVVSGYQLYETAAAGADAVLLIVRILSDAQLAEYIALCRRLRLDALVEVYDVCELERAQKAGARLIGVNNRDLRTFKTDPRRALAMRPLLGPGQVMVSASGIRGRRDVIAAAAAGVHAFLIGEALVTADDPGAFLSALTGGATRRKGGTT